MTYLITHLDDAWTLTVIHLRMSLLPVLIGLLVAVPLGALVQRTRLARRLTMVSAQYRFHHSVAGSVRRDALGDPDQDPR